MRMNTGDFDADKNVGYHYEEYQDCHSKLEVLQLLSIANFV